MWYLNAISNEINYILKNVFLKYIQYKLAAVSGVRRLMPTGTDFSNDSESDYWDLLDDKSDNNFTYAPAVSLNSDNCNEMIWMLQASGQILKGKIL